MGGQGRGRAGGGRDYPHLPVGTDTIPQIKHIVVLMMENHSYDNHLGMLAPPLLAVSKQALACNTTGPGTIPPPGSVTPPAH